MTTPAKWPQKVRLTPYHWFDVCMLTYHRVMSKHPTIRDISMLRSGVQSHYPGMGGEYAWCLLRGIPVNREISPYGDGKKADYEINGVKFEIKTVTWQGDKPELKLEKKEMFEDRNYVLVRQCALDEFEIYPAIPLKLFLQYAKTKDYGNGERKYLTGEYIIAIMSEFPEI